MKIVVDSSCDLTEDMKLKNGIDIESVPLSLQLEDKQFIDDETLNIDNYLVEMANCKGKIKTAAPSPDLYLEKYKGDESVFVVTISSHLSASNANAGLAKKMYLDEFSQKFIHVFDSLSASVGETMVALKLDELIKNNLSENEIVTKINSFIGNMRTYFILEKYDNLVKNGRINPYVAKLASILSIKPICAGIEGKMVLTDKARGTKNAVTKLVDTIAKESIDFENRVLGIAHVKCLEKAEAFKNEVMKRIPFRAVIIVEARGLCATYAEKDGLVIAY